MNSRLSEENENALSYYSDPLKACDNSHAVAVITEWDEFKDLLIEQIRLSEETPEKPDLAKPFIVRDGMLVSLGKPFGHLLTEKEFENYRLIVEYRFVGKPGNCGVLVHASKLRNLYKMYPKSIEVQMNHTHAGDFWCIVENIEVTNNLLT